MDVCTDKMLARLKLPWRKGLLSALAAFSSAADCSTARSQSS